MTSDAFGHLPVADRLALDATFDWSDPSGAEADRAAERVWER